MKELALKIYNIQTCVWIADHIIDQRRISGKEIIIMAKILNNGF